MSKDPVKKPMLIKFQDFHNHNELPSIKFYNTLLLDDENRYT